MVPQNAEDVVLLLLFLYLDPSSPNRIQRDIPVVIKDIVVSINSLREDSRNYGGDMWRKMADPARDTREGQHNNSQQYKVHSSPIKETWHPIENDKRDEWSIYVYPHVNTEIEWGEMLQKLCPTYKKGDPLAPKPPKMKKTKRGSGKSTYCDYLNKLSQSFVNNDSDYVINFRSLDDRSPLLHPTGTLCRPDIVAVRQYPISGLLHWSHLDATGEEGSLGKSIEEREAQAGTYTAYHMQARPDLVSVPGILVGKSHFKLFFSNACRIYRTCAIKWNDAHAQNLLYGWMWRLYHPECDPSITVDVKTSTPNFTVATANNRKHTQLVVFHAGESIGRRTIVLKSLDPDSSIVIKEQFIETGRRFEEGPILGKIHEGGRFPGVVRLDEHAYPQKDNQNISVSSGLPMVTRQKTRLVLKDKGPRLADAKTLRELLMGTYDLLEISRTLYSRRDILHRDISPDNVLLVEASVISTDPLHHDLGDMCFSEYLLQDPIGQDYSDPESDRRRRLMTRVIIIDFDCSEDRDPGKWSPGLPAAWTGTPIFMARIVRSPEYPNGLYELPSMPDVAPELLEHYRRTLKARLEAFPANTEEVIKVPEGATLASDEFQHLLRYEAESAFWHLMWCCIQAQPKKKAPKADLKKEGIPDNIWSALTGSRDARDGMFIRKFPMDCLHSSYAGLLPLLNDMRKQLQGDLSFSKTEEREKNPEYIHEAFQRLILNFLVANKNKPFLDLEINDLPRRAMENPMGRSGTQTQKKRTWEEFVEKIGREEFAETIGNEASAHRPWSNLHAYLP